MLQPKSLRPSFFSEYCCVALEVWQGAPSCCQTQFSVPYVRLRAGKTLSSIILLNAIEVASNPYGGRTEPSLQRMLSIITLAGFLLFGA